MSLLFLCNISIFLTILPERDWGWFSLAKYISKDDSCFTEV